MFEPKDGLRYGHKFWSDTATNLLLKARLVNEKGDVVEEFAFTDVSINPTIDKDMLKPTWASVPADWQVKQGGPGEVVPNDTGWSVGKVPAGFHEDHRRLSQAARASPIRSRRSSTRTDWSRSASSSSRSR